MLYMLDTNIVSYWTRGRSEQLRAASDAHAADDFCISAIVLSELEFGVLKSGNPARNQDALNALLAFVEVLPYGSRAAM